ncbi:MAG TPA: potassium channel family protein [Burkholderiaceae bacterium]|nr:potassium channel family protein [Burkholderiaceae bacterium]
MPILLRFFTRHLVVNPPVALRAVLLLMAVLAYGTSGFLYFELPGNPDLVWSDALWYSIVTLTTVGYGDFFPKSWGGRFLVGVPLMVIGIGLLGFILSVVATALITSKSKELKGMSTVYYSGHLILVNFPGLAKVLRLLDELGNDPSIGRDAQLVLIDKDLEELPPELVARKLRYVRGDPTRDETLQRAGIQTAAHAIVLTRNPSDPLSDALNVTIALAIEGRARQVNTVVECISPATEELLQKAGCDRIVCSARFDALYVSQELLNPGVQDVLGELLSNSGGNQFYVTPLNAAPGACFKDLCAAAMASGHMAIGLRRKQVTQLNLAPDHVIHADDMAVTIGTTRQAQFQLGAE